MASSLSRSSFFDDVLIDQAFFRRDIADDKNVLKMSFTVVCYFDNSCRHQVIESTYNHPFWVEGKGWTFVKDLKPGDLLVQSDGNTLKIDSIELEHKHATVYNMTVDDFHTYFVSDLGIWVHNTSCGWSGIAKTGSKPAGIGPHNEEIAEVANSVNDGKVISGGQQLPEISIKTPGGIKGSRRPDILVERQDGSKCGINVGKKAKSGAPIKREVEAINDLEDAGLELFCTI